MTESTATEVTSGKQAALLKAAIEEILRDAHRYAPGLEQHRPTLAGQPSSRLRKKLGTVREYLRDAVERTAGRGGFTRRHFDPSLSAARLARVIALAEGLEATYARLGDDTSRRAMVDLLKLRVLGPYHAQLAISPQGYRAKETEVNTEMRERTGTFDVSDPYFSPLSLYRVPVGGADAIKLHSSSVDIVSVYVLGQYTYAHSAPGVAVDRGDVVFDVGGCFGDTALLFANKVGPEGRVYTFEFDPENLEVMRENLALNPDLADRITVVENALWHTSGQTLSFVPGGRMTTVGTGNGGHSVTTITLDDFVDRERLERVDFVKMDVEGAELDVLGGAQNLLARFAPKLALAAYHKDDDLVQIREAVDGAARGYRYFLETYSPVEEETVLFATRERSST